jgi:hypothetical protein
MMCHLSRCKPLKGALAVPPRLARLLCAFAHARSLQPWPQVWLWDAILRRIRRRRLCEFPFLRLCGGGAAAGHSSGARQPRQWPFTRCCSFFRHYSALLGAAHSFGITRHYSVLLILSALHVTARSVLSLLPHPDDIRSHGHLQVSLKYDVNTCVSHLGTLTATCQGGCNTCNTRSL